MYYGFPHPVTYISEMREKIPRKYRIRLIIGSTRGVCRFSDENVAILFVVDEYLLVHGGWQKQKPAYRKEARGRNRDLNL